MEWMLMPYRRYAEFFGRSRRREFWLFHLFLFLISVVIDALFGVPAYRHAGFSFAYSVNLTGVGQTIQSLVSLASLVPSLAVAVRRLHDIERSGWWLLLIFLPILGWFTLFVFLCLDGTRGVNRYGSDPKDRGTAEVFR